MRLIDADKSLEDMKVQLEKALEDESISKDDALVIMTSAIALKEFVKRQPTAYDIDKIVKQLEELQERHPYKVAGDYDTYSQYNQAWESCSDQAIEIVKKGGAV